MLIKLSISITLHMFFEVHFFGSFGQLAVQAAHIWAVFGRQTW
jgi:hypothetical protein